MLSCNKARRFDRFIYSWPNNSVPDIPKAFQSEWVKGFSQSRAVKPFVSSWHHSQVVHASQFPFSVVTPDVFSCSAPACVYIQIFSQQIEKYRNVKFVIVLIQFDCSREWKVVFAVNITDQTNCLGCVYHNISSSNNLQRVMELKLRPREESASGNKQIQRWCFRWIIMKRTNPMFEREKGTTL